MKLPLVSVGYFKLQQINGNQKPEGFSTTVELVCFFFHSNDTFNKASLCPLSAIKGPLKASVSMCFIKILNLMEETKNG